MCMVKFVLIEKDYGKEHMIFNEDLGSDEFYRKITEIINSEHKNSPSRTSVKFQIKEKDTGEVALDSSMIVNW